MFKKRTQSSEVGRRRVQPQQRSNKVFSYYANRSSYDGSRSREASRAESDPAVSNRTKQERRHKQRLLLGVALCLILVATAIYNTMLTSEATVRISAKPEERMLLQKPADYQSTVQSVLAQEASSKTKITIDTDEISHRVLEKHPELADVKVVLPLIGRTITVDLAPAQVAARLIASDGKTYVLGSDGRAVSSDVSAAPTDTLVITDQSGLLVAVGRQVLPRNDMRFITRLQYQFASRDQKIETILLPAAGRQLHVKLDGDSYFTKFSFEGDVLQQFGAFQAVKKKLSADKVSPVEYIDVRVGDRAYYK